MVFGASVFGAIKLIEGLDSGWSRAKPGMRRAASVPQAGTVIMLAYRDGQMPLRDAWALQRFLEQQVGISKVIRVDDLFGGENFVRPACEEFSCQLCLAEAGREQEIRARLAELPFHGRLQVRTLRLNAAWNPDDHGFRQEITPTLLRLCAEVIEA
jgi:hypothetical protein